MESVNDYIETVDLRPFWLRPSLWFAMLLLVCFLAWPIFGETNQPTISVAFYLSSAIGLFAILGFWLGFGKSLWRIPTVIVAGSALALVMAASMDGPSNSETITILQFLVAIVVGIVSIPIFIVRKLKRARLAIPSAEWQATTGQADWEALQFKTIHLLILTTGVGVLFGIAQAFQGFFAELIFNSGGFLIVGKIGLTLGICSLCVIWATVGQSTLIRSGISLLVIGSICFLNFWIIRQYDGVFWSIVTGLFWLVITIFMWLIRWEGYRFMATQRKDETVAESELSDAEQISHEIPSPF